MEQHQQKMQAEAATPGTCANTSVDMSGATSPEIQHHHHYQHAQAKGDDTADMAMLSHASTSAWTGSSMDRTSDGSGSLAEEPEDETASRAEEGQHKREEDQEHACLASDSDGRISQHVLQVAEHQPQQQQQQSQQDQNAQGAQPQPQQQQQKALGLQASRANTLWARWNQEAWSSDDSQEDTTNYSLYQGGQAGTEKISEYNESLGLPFVAQQARSTARPAGTLAGKPESPVQPQRQAHAPTDDAKSEQTAASGATLTPTAKVEGHKQEKVEDEPEKEEGEVIKQENKKEPHLSSHGAEDGGSSSSSSHKHHNNRNSSGVPRLKLKLRVPTGPTVRASLGSDTNRSAVEEPDPRKQENRQEPRKQKAEETELYCTCRKPYDGISFMIECDACGGWFHGRCVGLVPAQSNFIDTYVCPECQKTTGRQTTWRKEPHSCGKVLRKRRYINYSITPDPSDVFERVDHVGRMQKREKSFLSADEVMDIYEAGTDISCKRLWETGFRRPMKIKRPDGLGLEISEDMSWEKVRDVLGPTYPLAVIDVETQRTLPGTMPLADWVTYLRTPVKDRAHVLNVISLEFSNTPLRQHVLAPQVARDLDCLLSCWVDDETAPEVSKPQVQYYCLMGPQGAWTDFHIDFGGTSVWYHVFRGEKVFYFIEPTEENLKAYTQWAKDPNQNNRFLGDSVDRCFKCVVKEGETLMIPSGWIHAVHTPKDSLVFGGNFIHLLALDMQLKIYGIERKLAIEAFFRYPHFERTTWFMAHHLARQSLSASEVKTLQPGIKALLVSLQQWRRSKRQELKPPAHVDPDHVITRLRELVKKQKTKKRSSPPPLKLTLSMKDTAGAAGDSQPAPQPARPLKLKMKIGGHDAASHTTSHSTGHDNDGSGDGSGQPRAKVAKLSSSASQATEKKGTVSSRKPTSSSISSRSGSGGSAGPGNVRTPKENQQQQQQPKKKKKRLTIMQRLKRLSRK